MDSMKEPAVPRDGEGHVLTEAMRAQARATVAPEPDGHGRRIRRSRKKGLARVLELTVRFLKTGSIHRQARYLRPKL